MRQSLSRRAVRTLETAGGVAVVVMGLWGTPAHGQFSVVQVAGNTTGNPLSRPVWVTSPQGDYRRVFIVEKQGRIRVLDITSPTPVLQQDTTPFLDIRSLIPTLAAGNSGNQDERGLLGLAFHPQYMTNGKFYVYYTTLPVAGLPNSATNYQNVVEYTNPNPLGNTANVNSARIIMQIPDPQTNHNGGWMGFGPDGYLYLVCGDGGGQNDSNAGHTAVIGNGQDTGVPLGKMMRIDINVTTTPAQGPFVPGAFASYGIPADNPTLSPLVDGTGTTLSTLPPRREIWAFGLRNPWRCSFDRLTGDLWIGDVGQNLWEEIDFQPALTAQNVSQVAGRNYGWRCWEGTSAFVTNSGTCAASFDSPGLTAPVGVYVHSTVPSPPLPREFVTISGTCSITGGFVYRGCGIPELYGRYVFTDYCSGRIWSTTLNPDGSAMEPTDHSTGVYAGAAGTVPPISAITRPTTSLVSFGEDSYGELYLVDQPNARVFKFVRSVTGSIINANCDVNFDGAKSVQDIFDYLGLYFGGSASADFNRTGTVSVQDIFDFLSCYFGNCTSLR